MNNDKIFDYLPPLLRDTAVIAGGYALDPERASDVDLWVLTDGGSDIATTRLRMLYYLRVKNIPHRESAVVFDDEHYPTAHLVATIDHGFAGKPVQLLVSEKNNAQELVDGFDISTHALAVDRTGKVTVSKHWTSLSEPARVMRWTTPEETLYRLEKISGRYRLPVDQRDVEALNAAVQKKAA